MEAANAAKRERHLVVVGNPSRNGNSQNKSKVRGKLTFAGEMIEPYTTVLGAPLGEQNPKYLQNDYVKFIGLSERLVQAAGGGVVGKITSSSWLEGTSFRGMRAHLQMHLGATCVVDLHGHIRSRGTAPDGSADEGVFDIEEGTAILVAAHGAGNATRVAHLWGRRGSASAGGKLRWLISEDLDSAAFESARRGPILWKYFAKGGEVAAQYAGYEAINMALPASKLGFQTHRDHFAVAFDESTMRTRLRDLQDASLSDEETKERHRLSDNRDWRMSGARAVARRLLDGEALSKVEFRPFDVRWGGLNDAFMDYSRQDFVSTFAPGTPILNVSRQQSSLGFHHALVSSAPKESCYISDRTKEQGYMVPLFLRPTPTEPRRPNVSPAFARALVARTGLVWADGLPPYLRQGRPAQPRRPRPPPTSPT